jgi:predicted TIM-barrel fold metal-dependent hydrolase
VTRAASEGWIDYWCNGFAPAMRERWDAAIDAQGIPLRVHPGPDDNFIDPAGMLARMDQLGVATLVLPSAEPPTVDDDPTEYTLFTTPPSEIASLHKDYPGRFAGLVSIDPCGGMEGVEAAAQTLARPGFVGLHLHTHSFDRRFDDRDLYPYYALASDAAVPVVVQAGTSGGRMASECGRPIGIDRPALYFDRVNFVLSHTGWPWVDEALAMALKHPNVFLGTAAYPPHHWSAELVRFIRGAGRGKAMLGTSYPVVGHARALERLEALELDAESEAALVSGAARRVFRRIETSS